MSNPIERIVIVGGGSAGWLTACVLASEYQFDHSIAITLVESPSIQHIGVGEGTWPSMKQTLARIGISENDFLNHCQASFKQGSQFINWGCGRTPDHYHHPFTPPATQSERNTAAFWQPYQQTHSFAEFFSIQPKVIEQGLAPKQISTPEYAFIANYGYHLDAGKFVQMLTEHGKRKLNIHHLLDDIVEIQSQPGSDEIAAVVGQRHGAISGDLFIDCTGFRSLLLGQHYGIDFIEQDSVLFNDRAIAAQVPYPLPDAPIASATLSTAQEAGWVWDIGLQNRRGVGYVYSSSHSNESQAEQVLSQYIKQSGVSEVPEFRSISIRPGYRERFWHKNCVAVGMAAGFIEPLEASALVMVEMAAQYLAEQLPQNQSAMPLVASHYNDCFTRRWQQIMEFLKLHYVLSNRTDTQYWRDNKSTDSIPDTLQEKLTLWQTSCPSHYDFGYIQELFPAASYQYIYYGMGGQTRFRPTASLQEQHQAMQQRLRDNEVKSRQWLSRLPSNRQLLNQIQAQGLAT
ncbi:Tryptophan 7-halogenase [Saliniradius amylolyticus]|uniref:Tryptophan 7-halogenase n=1 Tax=Saliniradius amylolyticus TaxID=2183582 RepID=A0A2S2E190_9ALTE|nr:tryptophan halogenase family protein [Saliniradius amylolyticus]AWL11393.1 Tryptophan 7-halogenase [Saliniradius amylolyticus]